MPFNKKPERDYWWLMWAFLALVGIGLLWGSASGAQEIVIDPVPEFNTWEEFVAFYWPKIIQTAMLVLSGIVAWGLRTVVALAPVLIREWVDAKRQKDLHSAIMSIVAKMMQEGRWPTADELKAAGGRLSQSVIEEVRDYANDSVAAATKRFGIELPTEFSDKIFDTLSKRMSLELSGGKPLPVVVGNNVMPDVLRNSIHR